jgi:adenylate cyclase
MGFWGWPLEQANAVERACQAALNIRSAFDAAARCDDHPLTDFRVGIGVATGLAVAGKIGTVDQVKVTVFGPVVNLASRLETMTKILRAPLLIDQRTAERVRAEVSPDVARVRRVARVRPYGMDAAEEVCELLPPRSAFPQLTDQHIAAYERALDALQARNWEEAFQWLHQVPAEDRVKDFLTVFIAQHNRMPPADWDGVIPIASK